MCGRFSEMAKSQALGLRFKFKDPGVYLPRRFNAAPMDAFQVVVNGGERRLETMRWGLIPHWAKDPAIGNKLINARAESLLEKPSFRDSLRNRRCLVLADGFYEWERRAEGQTKIPHRIVLASREAFAMAGLYDRWVDPQGQGVPTFTIITTAANELLKPIHDRMPVILAPEGEDEWLSDAFNPFKSAHVLRPYPSELMARYAVSSLVNSPRNNSEDCILP